MKTMIVIKVTQADWNDKASTLKSKAVVKEKTNHPDLWRNGEKLEKSVPSFQGIRSPFTSQASSVLPTQCFYTYVFLFKTSPKHVCLRIGMYKIIISLENP